jgi:hypothetical protein
MVWWCHEEFFTGWRWVKCRHGIVRLPIGHRGMVHHRVGYLTGATPHHGSGAAALGAVLLVAIVVAAVKSRT